MSQEKTKNTYKILRTEFSMDGQNIWIPDINEWRILEEYDNEKLLSTPSIPGQVSHLNHPRDPKAKHSAPPISACSRPAMTAAGGGALPWIDLNGGLDSRGLKLCEKILTIYGCNHAFKTQAITKVEGIVRRVMRLFDELAKTDSKRVLGEVREVTGRW